MPKIEAQTARGPRCEGNEGLRIRRLRIPMVYDSMGDLDVGVKIPFLQESLDWFLKEKTKQNKKTDDISY